MNTMDEIQKRLEGLSSRERQQITRWLLDRWEEPHSSVEEPAAAYAVEPELRRMTVEEYLQFEDTNERRHEYVAGLVFAMSGTSVRHGMIVQNLSNLFHNHLKGGPCKTFTSGVQVSLKISSDSFFYSPDIMVVCNKLNVEGHHIPDPKLIVEVLSPSTENIDRREKATNYRHATSLEEYVLVAQRTMDVTMSRRGEGWKPQVLKAAEQIAEFRSIGLSLPVPRLYEGIQ